ncbi:MAG: tRNA 2-thiouridine(34) synthase MnmA [Gammaproteobacteria bacterium]
MNTARHSIPVQKAIVGLSGGVDSSVSALLLWRQGYKVEGVFMQNWEEADGKGCCAAAKDVLDASAVCKKLDVPLHTVNLSQAYWNKVFEPFLAALRAGLTPNPDILCNREIKFKAFLDQVLGQGADLVATGHYARVRMHDGTYQLLKGLDSAKDQSYFLYTLGQTQLARVVFPVGGLNKQHVRRLAAEAGFITHDKKDSTGICFIGERPFKEFLARYLPIKTGEIQTPDGKVIGEHDGVIFYTLGQRKGLGVGGVRQAGEAPWYVIAKDLEKNILTVAQGHDHPMLLTHSLVAKALSWVSGETPRIPYRCFAKTRYRQADQACTLVRLEGDSLCVRFDAPQRAVTPGQSVVFYQGAICLGGGVIEKTI